jgi:hypothetical protein
MGLPSDFNTKIPVTIGLIIWVAIISFSMGMLYKGHVDADKRIEDNKEYTKEQIDKAREYTTQEIEGLRADWERDKKEQERRLVKLEK